MLKDKLKKLINDPKVQKAVKEKVIPLVKKEKQIKHNPYEGLRLHRMVSK